MGNAQIPKRADEIDREYGTAADGTRVEAVVYRHVPRGHTLPKFWVVQYRRTEAGRIDKGTRGTRQYSGDGAEQRVAEDFAEVRGMLVQSRTPAAPKRGTRFLHSRQITKTSTIKSPQPEICEVTRVARETVWYRNSTGFRSYVSVDRFGDIVKELVASE